MASHFLPTASETEAQFIKSGWEIRPKRPKHFFRAIQFLSYFHQISQTQEMTLIQADI